MGSAARDLRRAAEQTPITATTSLGDAALLTAAAQGQAGSVGALYDRYRDGALAVALSVTADEMEAEDVVQEVFEALPRMARSYHVERGQPPQWLFRSVRNRAIDHVRRRTRQAARMVGPSAENEALLAVGIGRAPNPADEAEAEEMLELIQGLEPRYAHLVRLAFVDGWSHSAIAGMTGLPLGTVKTRIRLSLQLIRAQMSEADVTPTPIAGSSPMSTGIYVVGANAPLAAAVRRSVAGTVPTLRLPRLPRGPMAAPAALVVSARSRSRADQMLRCIDDLGWTRVPVTLVGPASLAHAGSDRDALVVPASLDEAGPALSVQTAVAATLSTSADPEVGEAATRRLLANASEAVMLIDRLGRVVRATSAAATLFGLSPRQLNRRYMTDLTAMPSGWTELQWHRLVTRGWWSDRSLIRRGDGGSLDVHAVGWSGSGSNFVSIVWPIAGAAS